MHQYGSTVANDVTIRKRRINIHCVGWNPSICCRNIKISHSNILLQSFERSHLVVDPAVPYKHSAEKTYDPILIKKQVFRGRTYVRAKVSFPFGLNQIELIDTIKNQSITHEEGIQDYCMKRFDSYLQHNLLHHAGEQDVYMICFVSVDLLHRLLSTLRC